MEYTVEKTRVRVIPYSHEWEAASQMWVRRLWDAFYARGEVPPPNFGQLMGGVEYGCFLALTRQLCESAPVVKLLTSAKGADR